MAARDGGRRPVAGGAGRERASLSPSSNRIRPRGGGPIGEQRVARSARSIRRCRTAAVSPPAAAIAIFFYDGPISRAVAFEQLLARGEHLAHRLLGAFSDTRTASAAGEHRHGRRDVRPPPPLRRDGARLRAAAHRGAAAGAKLTNYGEHLAAPSAHARSADRGANLVELRARRGALAQRLRLQHRRERRAGISSGARRCARRSTGCATRPTPIFAQLRRRSCCAIPGWRARTTSK